MCLCVCVFVNLPFQLIVCAADEATVNLTNGRVADGCELIFFYLNLLRIRFCLNFI